MRQVNRSRQNHFLIWIAVLVIGSSIDVLAGVDKVTSATLVPINAPSAPIEPDALLDVAIPPLNDGLALTDEGLARRERLVLSLCRSVGIPVAGVLGGGYSHDLDALVARHALMFEEASRVSRDD